MRKIDQAHILSGVDELVLERDSGECARERLRAVRLRVEVYGVLFDLIDAEVLASQFLFDSLHKGIVLHCPEQRITADTRKRKQQKGDDTQFKKKKKKRARRMFHSFGKKKKKDGLM